MKSLPDTSNNANHGRCGFRENTDSSGGAVPDEELEQVSRRRYPEQDGRSGNGGLGRSFIGSVHTPPVLPAPITPEHEIILDRPKIGIYPTSSAGILLCCRAPSPQKETAPARDATS
jgi:hypothetical protein